MPTLKWLGDAAARVAARKVPYCIFEPIETVGDPTADNLLIQGDNLEALKALLPFYAGRVKCIFIDPPYNTKSAFDHYDDNLEHSQWLSMMYPRLELLCELLSEDGSIWVTIDDNEAHYLKALMDEILGRSNFIANVVWEKSDSPRMDAQYFSSRHDHVLVYAKDVDLFRVKRGVGFGDALPEHYDRVTSDGRPYYLKPLRAMGGEDSRAARPTMYFPITAPDGSEVYPKRQDGSDGRWRWGEERVREDAADIEWVAGRGGWAPYYRVYGGESARRPPETIWTFDDVGSNRTSKAELKKLFGDVKGFDTPKPEGLIRRIIELSTDAGNIVLDSFLGSGTTSAVAHKLGRTWIGVELGEHARTLCVPRLKKVVEGEQGGISASVGWQGGGGFRFMKLGAKAFFDDGALNADIRFKDLAAYLWFLETRTPHGTGQFTSPLLGIHDGIAYVLLYNGIIADRRPESGNVLTTAVWNHVRPLLPRERRETVIYGEASRFSDARLKDLKIAFKQIPYDVGMR